MKKLKIIYFALPVLVAVVYILIEATSIRHGSSAQDVATFSYLSGIACVCMTMLAAFTTIIKKTWNVYLRMMMPIAAAFVVLLDVYLFDRNDYAYALPLLSVAYFFVWPADKTKNKEEEA